MPSRPKLTTPRPASSLPSFRSEAHQGIVFSSLTDHRGNALPSSIDVPVIIPIAKNAIPVAVIGLPNAASFQVAKTTSTPDDAIIDLWIIEART